MSLHVSGQFRCGAQRDDRRRRLLSDEIYTFQSQSSSNSSTTSDSPANGLSHYGDGSFMDEETRLLDLVPRRMTVIFLWFAAGLAIITGIELLYRWRAELIVAIPGEKFLAFDLHQSGNLYSWFSSLMLLAAAVMAWLAYTVRRHRMDDYSGRYRIWIWAALCWFLAASDVAVNMHDCFKQVMIHFTKTHIWGDGSLWWIVSYVLVFCALGSRLILDMRPCRLSIAALITAAISYSISASMELGIITGLESTNVAMLSSGAAMLGHLLLLSAMALSARYVILDSEGLIEHPAPKLYVVNGGDEKKAVLKTSDESKDEWTRVDSPVGTPQPVLRRTPAPTPVSTPTPKPTFATSITPPVPVNRKLTKQEKKALKEKLLRERQERERKGKW